MLTLPVLARRKKQPYLAIRSALTMRQIKKQGPLFLSEVRAHMQQRGYESDGPAFFRYNAIDPTGQLEMEFGYFTQRAYPGSGPIRTGVMPSGRYASVTWQGSYDRLRDVTAMLLGWAAETGVSWDIEQGDRGALFAGRLEIYHNDPETEADPDRLVTEVAIKTGDKSDADD